MYSGDEILADRLNGQPTIFRGCTSQELTAIAIISTLFWIPVMVMVLGALGNFAAGFSIGAILIGATMFVVATIFQKIKRGRPEGYYQQKLECIMEDRGLRKSHYIRRSGYWSLGRTKRDKSLYFYYQDLKKIR